MEMARIGTRSIFASAILNSRVTKRSLQPKRNLHKYTVTVNRREYTLNMRFMVKEDIPQITELRRRTGFHDPISCYSIYTKVDPKCIIVVDNGEGLVVGILSGINNNDGLCTVGMRTIHEDYRKLSITTKMTFPYVQELGGIRALMGHSRVHLSDYNDKKLPILERNYFILRYESPQGVNPDNLSSHLLQHVDIQEFDDSHLESILDYDQAIMGYRRELSVTLTCRDQYSKTFAAFKGSKCVGYGIIKQDILGCSKLGPLYADDPLIAETLLKKLIVASEFGKGFVANCVSNNSIASRLFQKLGIMEPIFTYRAYTKTVSTPDTKNVYGIFELEFELL